MKTYKLLKEIPFLGIGLIFKQTKDNPDWYDTGNCWVKFHKNVIEGNKEYFKLIEEKEFTESDVREAIRLTSSRAGHFLNSGLINEIITGLRK